MIEIFYVLKSGGHMMKTFPSMLDGAAAELERLSKRRTEAEAWVKGGDRSIIGASWKNEGRWVYSYDASY